MRFAGGAGGVGLPTVCSLLVMALPCFVLILCDLEREEIERIKRYPLVFCSTLMIYFPGLGNHAHNAVEKRMSCSLAS